MPHIDLAYERLFMYDPYELEKGNFVPIPWLAESYTVSADGLVWTVKLRKGIKFHNTGNEFTAKDVIYTFNRHYFWMLETMKYGTHYPPDLVDPSEIGPGYWDCLNRTELVNDYEVKFYLNYYFAAFKEVLGSPTHGVIDSEECEAHAQISDGKSDHGYNWLQRGVDGWISAGTGPYMVKDFKLYEKYVMTRYEDYWGGPPELNLPKPKIDEVVMLAIIESVDARMRILRGELDIAAELEPITWKALKDKEGITGIKAPADTYQRLDFHTWSGPLKDWRVRKAISMAVDYDAYAEDVMLGAVETCQGIIFQPGQPGWKKDAKYYPGVDYDGANALLDEAEYPVQEDGFRFKIEIQVRPAPRFGCNYIDLATAIKADLAEIGIDVLITVFEVGEWYARIGDPTFPEFGWLQPCGTLSITEPGFMTYTITNNGLTHGWNSTSQGVDVEGNDIWETASAMLVDVQAELDPDTRIEKWQALNRYMLEYGPNSNLFANFFLSVHLDKVKNFYYSTWELWPSIFWIDIT